MADTYTQIHLHVVFAVKFRAALISRMWKQRLLSYITAVLQNHGHKMICVNTMPDHIHMLFGLSTTQTIADIIRTVKSESSEWVNANKFCRSKFRWQEGYAAFDCCKSHISAVATYIENQEEHHKKTTFLEEYVSMLNKFEVDYNVKYIFTEPI